MVGLERKEWVKVEIRHSCTTNNISDPNYFEDYVEKKWKEQKVKPITHRFNERGC
jgi:hypothetical protein